MKRRNLRLILSAIGLMVLILDSSNAVSAASAALEVCVRTVIPSLFPFFVLSIYLTSSAGCGVSSILISGFLGGYPVGAQSAAEAYRNGYISKEYANRLLMFCSQAGPSFLFGIAAAQFPEREYGWMLWAVQILSAIGVAQMLPAGKKREGSFPRAGSITLSQSMSKAIRSMVSVCGWVILFRVILTFLHRWLLWWLPDAAGILVSGLLELTNGCLQLGKIPDISLRFLCAVLMLNFGGICVMMQTASVAEGLDLRYYIGGKILQTLFSFMWAALFLGYFVAVIPIFLIFLLPHMQNLRKNSSIPDPVGV